MTMKEQLVKLYSEKVYNNADFMRFFHLIRYLYFIPINILKNFADRIYRTIDWMVKQ